MKLMIEGDDFISLSVFCQQNYFKGGILRKQKKQKSPFRSWSFHFGAGFWRL